MTGTATITETAKGITGPINAAAHNPRKYSKVNIPVAIPRTPIIDKVSAAE